MNRCGIVVCAVWIAALGACGDDSSGATDTPREDAAEEGAADVPAEDVVPETAGDAPVDPGPEAEAEAAADVESDTAADAGADGDAGPLPDADGPCERDTDCAAGLQWCEDGVCVDCDNSGLFCDLACESGYEPYERNGCHPCDCAPVNECVADADCPGIGGGTAQCYAGHQCWYGCEDDPSCCRGNWCDAPGCTEPTEWRTGCCLWGCPGEGFCTFADCAACDPSCEGGEWVGLTEACGHCTYGGGDGDL
jgi:hypothetical protein